MRKAYVSLRKIAAVFGLVFFLYTGMSAVEESSSTPLFSDPGILAGETALNRGPSSDGGEIIRSRLVNVNFDQLCRLQTDDPNPLVLNLFDDITLTAQFYNVEPTFSGGTAFTGFIEDHPGAGITMVKTGEVLSANIHVDGRFFLVRFESEGIHRIDEIDQHQFPQELPPVPAAVTPREKRLETALDTGIYIDVLVVYTAVARSGAGGTTAMENLIDLAISESNTGYGNSGVTQRLRLVHTAEVVYDEASFNWSTTLTRLRSTSDGYMDNVHTLRDTYGADEVALIVNDTASCGIGYVMQSVSTSFAPYAFVVVSRICATGYYSLAHEWGHNMGCAHDRANASVLGAYDYSFGYQAPDEAFRTIMAYNCPGGCTRVNYWSNPDKQYGGQPMGVVYTDPAAADNRMALNNTLSSVRNFRQQVTAPTITVTSPDGGETFAVGSSQAITWTTTGTVGNVLIQYSANNGSSWSTVIASTANDGSYTWTVPDNTSSTCLVKISEAADNNPTDTSDSTFSIVSTSSPTITVTSPNGGETFNAGSSQNITWTTTGTVGNVKIEYSTNNGSDWSTVTSSTANDGSYAWTVPNKPSTNCLVRISEASDGSPTDTSNNKFSIVSSTTPTITVTAPNGGEEIEKGSSFKITWTTGGTVGNVKIQYSTNNGGSWSTVTSSTANDGSYTWTVPDKTSSTCLIKISEASDGSPSDTSNSTFSIVSIIAPTITVTAPNGGETFDAGTSTAITWTSSGTVGNVKIQYSTNNGSSWSTVTSSTGNDGSYSWKVPEVNSSKCLVKIGEASDGSPSDTSNEAFTINIPTPPEISLNRTALNYGAIPGGSTTGGQLLLIENTGGGTLNWEIDGDASWLSVSPDSGTGAGVVTVTVNASGLALGTYTGTLSITDPEASNSPQTVTVTLTVKNASADQPPFGEFATPTDGSTGSSSIPVTGWVLDDVEVMSVKIYNGADYIGDAVFVEGARSDIEQAYSSHPKNYQAGWGYMLLSNFLPNGGNGTYTLYARATDSSGKVVSLGSKTVHINNASAVKPFGAIDSPAQGGTVSGNKFTNSGWVLTPLPNKIPVNGSTISVYIDGVKLGTANYNGYREDIATLFPGYANSGGASAWLKFDTTDYSNGIHSIYWIAEDDAGNADGIGSRFFTVQNTGNDKPAQAAGDTTGWTENWKLRPGIPMDYTASVEVINGYRAGIKPQEVYPDETGIITIETVESERVEIRLNSSSRQWLGKRMVDGELRPLPIGSTFDAVNGVFYWGPGPGFVGIYEFIFIDNDGNNAKRIRVNILPK